MAKAKSKSKVAPKPSSKSSAKVAPKVAPKAASKAAPKAAPKKVAKAAKPAAKPAAKQAATKSAPKAAAKNTAAKVAPKAAAKPAAKTSAKTLAKTAKPAAKVAAPKAAPKATANPAAKAVKTPNPKTLEGIEKAFSPLDDRVVVQREEALNMTAGGIYIPDSATENEKPNRGRVLAVGLGGRDKKGRLRPLDVQLGDLVIFDRYAGSDIDINGEKLTVLREKDIVAVVN